MRPKQFLPQSVQNLSRALCRLPGIGPKTANRLTFYLLNRPTDEVEEIGRAFNQLKLNLKTCGVCYTISESDPCLVCADAERDGAKIMIVEEPLDMLAMERTGFDGVYHVLGGVISPINGVGPRDLKIAELVLRATNKVVVEVILATDPSLEGEATASYITESLGVIDRKDLHISRLARGLPVGGDLEYADEMTLRRALEGRQNYRVS